MECSSMDERLIHCASSAVIGALGVVRTYLARLDVDSRRGRLDAWHCGRSAWVLEVDTDGKDAVISLDAASFVGESGRERLGVIRVDLANLLMPGWLAATDALGAVELSAGCWALASEVLRGKADRAHGLRVRDGIQAGGARFVIALDLSRDGCVLAVALVDLASGLRQRMGSFSVPAPAEGGRRGNTLH